MQIIFDNLGKFGKFWIWIFYWIIIRTIIHFIMCDNEIVFM